MATFLEGGVDMVPPIVPFQPNYNLILNTLQYRQGQYDQGFAQVKNAAGSIINAQLTNETNIEKRKQILANAESALKSLPTVDLSLPENVTAANSVFKPFYEDSGILKDITFTKGQNSQLQYGMNLQQSAKEEDRKRYWSIGIQDLQDNMEAFRTATPDQLNNFSVRRYVGKPQAGEEIIEMFNSGKLVREVDKVTGQYKVTDVNGREIVTPLSNLFLSKIQANPEEMEAYNVYGRVIRNRYIRDNETRFGSKDAAAAEHDRILLNDYKKYNTQLLEKNNDALTLVNNRIAEWKKRDVSTLSEKEINQFAQDINDAEDLKQKNVYFKTALDTAADNILGNPTAYVGQTYMHKSARDLAGALGSFGKRNLATDPVLKDIRMPFELEKFKTDEAIRQKVAENELEKERMRLQADLDEASGKTTTGDGTKKTKTGALKNNLDTPIVSDNPAGSAVADTDNKIPSAYKQYLSNKKEVIQRLVASKVAFVNRMLTAEEFVNDKGEVMDQNEKAALMTSSDGRLLDKLIDKANKKLNGMIAANSEDRFEPMMLREKVDANNNLWKAMDTWRTNILNNISNNLQIGDKNDFLYKHVVKNGMLESDVNKFMQSVAGDQTYKNNLQRLIEEESRKPRKAEYRPVPSPGGVAMQLVTPMVKSPEMIKKEYDDSLTNMFTTYRNNVIYKFNTGNKGGGYNFITEYDPKAGSGGGGVHARKLTFAGSSDVVGEEADKIVLDLVPNLEGAGDEDVVYVAGGDKPGADITTDSTVKETFNNVFKPALLVAAKAGNDSTLKSFTITSSMVGGGNANYHAYTFTFDPDYINKMKGTDSKEGLINDDVAKKIANGVTIYVKADKDNTNIAKRSSIGEIEMLVNSSKTGVLDKEVAPGYNFRIEKKIQGGYKIISTYNKITQDNPEGKPVERVIDVDSSADLSYMYYTTISNLNQLYIDASNFQKSIIQNAPNRTVYTMQDVLDRAKQLRSQQ